MIARPARAFRFADLFAGLGGFHLAAAKLGGECVFACEIEEDLRAVYRQNFRREPAGDIREVRPSSVPDHDLLCAGFPCQPFSKAGEQMGWGDRKARGTVFDNLAEILRVKQPALVVLENVAHFVNHDDGNTYRKVCATLKQLGYEVDYRQYSPHQFGIPQIRERIYMVARLGSLDGFTWPEPNEREPHLSAILDAKPKDAMPLSAQVVDCLDTWQHFLDLIPASAKLPSFPIWAMEFGATYPADRGRLDKLPLAKLRRSLGNFGDPLARLSWEKMTARLPSHALRKSDPFPTWKRTFIRQNREFYVEHQRWLSTWLPELRRFPPSLQKLEWNCQGEDRDIWKYVLQFRASGVRVKRPSTSPSLVAMTTTQIPIVGWERRYMTARECARLQSMDALKHLPKGIRAYRALGNAVNVNVVSAILRQLLNSYTRDHDAIRSSSVSSHATPNANASR
ncbi:MAG: DNA (cytosine-5-)-methyltransferase [Chthoniobacteraceae bacterium]